MRLGGVVGAVVVLGLAIAGWFYRGSAPVAGAVRAVGVQGENTTPDTATTLQSAGVHKCVGSRGTSYIDGACPAGSHEVAATHGTLTVTSLPKPAKPAASSLLGGPLVKPVDPEERDRLRDKAIEDAANRR